MTETTEILKERGQRYGRFDGHANVTQRLKQVIATELHIRRKELANDQQESLDMICHKIGRIINGDADYEDSWRDIAGYAQLVADRLLEPGKAEEKISVVEEDVRRHIAAAVKNAVSKMGPDMEMVPNKSNSIMAEDRRTREIYIWDGDNWLLASNPEMLGVSTVESVKQTWDETLKSSAPEPVLPAGWTRPSKAYPQVAEDPSTRWQCVWVDGRWNRLIKPLHEMSPAELEDLDRGAIWEIYKP